MNIRGDAMFKPKKKDDIEILKRLLKKARKYLEPERGMWADVEALCNEIDDELGE